MSRESASISQVLLSLSNYLENKTIEKIEPVFVYAITNRIDLKEFENKINTLGLILPKSPEIVAATLMVAFKRAKNLYDATIADIKKFEYVGVVYKDTRKFCISKIGKNFSLSKIEKMSNAELNPPIIFGGGWGCPHIWEPNPFE